MFTQFDKQFSHHTDRLEFIKVGAYLVAETIDMFTDFGSEQPQKQWVDAIHKIMISYDKLNDALYQDTSDVACLMREEML